jgi:hypothetical protein
METQRQRIIVESDMDESGTTAPATPDGQAQESDAARSARNIADWMSYLPPRCVNSMIAMGWDIST